MLASRAAYPSYQLSKPKMLIQIQQLEVVAQGMALARSNGDWDNLLERLIVAH
jgi:hypothetical protein